ncbi:MAG TPA: hypothetical protein VEA78_00335, partial [Acidimicrobiales bacterium]|nr:hypothetical protein [Acidimicrobiales bacterium]
MAAAVAAAIVLQGPVAWAQYGNNNDNDNDNDEDETTTTSRPPVATTIVQDNSTTSIVEIEDDDAESPTEAPAVQGAQAPDSVAPGQAVPVSTSFGAEAGEPLPANQPVTVTVRPATAGSQPAIAVQATTDANGNVSVTLSPDQSNDLADGVYLVFVVLPEQRDANGNVTRRARVAVAALVVKRPEGTADTTPAAVDPDAESLAKGAFTPAVEDVFEAFVDQIDAGGEDALMDAVDDGATLSVEGAQLL